MAVSQVGGRGRWVRGSAWLLVGNGVSISATGVAEVLIARTLGPGGFGVYSVVLSVMGLVTAVTTFGLDYHLVTELGSEDDRQRYSNVVSAAYVVTLPLALALLVGILVLGPSSWAAIAYLAFADVVFSPLLLARTALQVREKHKAIVASALTSRTVWVALVAGIAVIRPASPLTWIIAGRVVTNLAEAVVQSRLAALPFWPTFGKGRAVKGFEVLRSAWPLAAANLSSSAYQRLDQVLLGAIRGRVETGKYAAGVRIAELLNVGARVVQTVSLPAVVLAWKQKAHDDFQAALKDMSLLLMVPGGLAVAFLLAGNERLATLILGSEYIGTGKVIVILAIAELPVFLSTIVISGTLAVGARKALALASGLGLLVNLVGNLLFVGKYGAIAAGWASLAGYSTTAGILALGVKEVRSNIGPVAVTFGKVCVALGAATLPLIVLRLDSIYSRVLLSGTLYGLAVTALMHHDISRVFRWARTQRRTGIPPR